MAAAPDHPQRRPYLINPCHPSGTLGADGCGNQLVVATGRIFLIAAACAVVSLIAVLFIKEVPLRRTVAK